MPILASYFLNSTIASKKARSKTHHLYSYLRKMIIADLKSKCKFVFIFYSIKTIKCRDNMQKKIYQLPSKIFILPKTVISSDIPLQIQDFLKPVILSKYGCSRQVGWGVKAYSNLISPNFSLPETLASHLMFGQPNFCIQKYVLHS
jgi:hypothetical protein